MSRVSANSRAVTVRTLSIDELRREGQSLGRDQFLAKHSEPFLVVEDIGGQGDMESFSTVNGVKASGRRAAVEAGTISLRARAMAIKKRDKANEYANMITVGRAPNNDIAVEIASVSKFHAYFTYEKNEQRWYLHDAGSANGTWLNGEKLGESQKKVPITDGAAIQLGPDARARFFGAGSLWDVMIGKRSDKPQGS